MDGHLWYNSSVFGPFTTGFTDTSLGMPFRVLTYSAHATSQFQQAHFYADLRPQQLLPLRKRDHPFTLSDFYAYEEARDSLLRSDPRIGRAALLSGGILWRLAIECLMPDIVLEAPGDLALAYGIGYTLWDRTNNVYVEDDLTEHEIRLIVGTYVHEPEARADLSGYGLPSWWPQPFCFDESSLNFGWWSPVAEHWYRQVLEKCRAGEAQPKVTSKWQRSIRNWDKRGRQVTRKTREAALTFLRAHHIQ